MTRNKDPIQFRHRYQYIDLLTLRQLLGEITKQEIKELNCVFGCKTETYFTRSSAHPAQINGWNYIPFGIWFIFGVGMCGYAKFVKHYNHCWYIAPFVPLVAYWALNWSRQPNQEVENCYKYLLAKRAATCELENYKKKFAENPITKAKEYQ